MKLGNMNWPLLREQKAWLIKQADTMASSDMHTPEEVAYADGLINLIDSIQDTAVIDKDATDDEVFGEEVVIINPNIPVKNFNEHQP